MTVRLSTLGPQGPFSIKICERLLLSYTAWCLPTCLVRRWSYKGAQQLPSCHGYARPGGEISTQNAANFGLGRPQWAEARRTQGLVFGAAGRKCQSSRRASPVIGVRGKPPMSARCAKALIEGGPQRIFGYFLCEQKVTPASPIKKMNPFPLTATQKTDKIFWQIRKTAWKRKSTRL